MEIQQGLNEAIKKPESEYIDHRADHLVAHQIKPGQVLNPAGKRTHLPDLKVKVRRFLEELDPKHPDRTRLQSLFQELFHLVETGSKQAVKACELLLSYGFGKPSSSAEDLDAIAAGGIRVLVLPALPSQPAPPAIPVSVSVDAEFTDVRSTTEPVEDQT